MKLARNRERDAFYYDKVLSWLSLRTTDKCRPDFVYIQTIWNHSPHDLTYVDEGGPYRVKKIADSEFDEYMRRLRMSCREYANFREELARRFPDRPFVIVRFGDHQPPFAAHRPSGKAPPQNDADTQARYRTFFAIDAVNFDPVVDPELPETIEAAYVGVIALEAAGLPLDAVNVARRDLMVRHGGKLFFADESGEIAAQFNRRMIEAGLITPH